MTRARDTFGVLDADVTAEPDDVVPTEQLEKLVGRLISEAAVGEKRYLHRFVDACVKLREDFLVPSLLIALEI